MKALDRVRPHDVIVRRIGARQRAKPVRMCRPIEVSIIDDDAAESRAVPADVFCRGINRQRRAVAGRLAQARPHRVVDDEGNSKLRSDLRDLLDRERHQLRVRQHLAEKATGPSVRRAPEILRVARIDEACFDPQPPQRGVEELPRAAIEIGRTDEIVAGHRDIEDGRRDRRLAGGDGKRADAAIQHRHALLEHIGGRIYNSRIGVPIRVAGKYVGGLARCAELVGRGLKNRHRDCLVARIAAVGAVQTNGFVGQ